MPESSEEKTKRKLASLITHYEWTDQHSVFYEDIEDCPNLLIDTNKLKAILRKNHPNLPFLVCYRTIYKSWKGLQAYITIFSTIKIENITEILDKSFSASTISRYRKTRRAKIEATGRAIRNQSPHKLNLFFDKAVRRYSVLNKAALEKYKIQPEENL